MTPETKDRLLRYTLIAKEIIYDAQRMQQFLKMMETKDGAITAVKAVMGVIDNRKPIPADLAPLLGVNIYMLLVDVAQEVTGGKPNPLILRDVITKIVKGIQPIPQAAGQSLQPPQQQQAQARPGLMQTPMGA